MAKAGEIQMSAELLEDMRKGKGLWSTKNHNITQSKNIDRARKHRIYF